VIDSRSGSTCRRVTPENGGAQYQPVRLIAPPAPTTEPATHDETPRPLAAPTVTSEPPTVPILSLPTPPVAPATTPRKGKQGSANAGPMQQLAMF